MRIVTIKDIQHLVYESDTEFLASNPSLPIRTKLAELEQGEWIRSEQGFIVQCLIKKTYVDMSRGTGARKTPRLSYYFKFPRMSKTARHNQLDKTLYYFPTSNKFASDALEDYPLANRPKVRLFVEYIKHGLAPDVAYARAFNKHSKRQTAFLLSRKDIMDAIMHNNGAFMKEELEAAGLSKALFAEEIVKIVKDNKENAVVRKWALETVNNVLNNVQAIEDTQSFDPVLQASLQPN